MSTTQNIESYDSLYEKMCDDTPDGQDPISEEQFNRGIDELHTTDYIVFRRHEDNVFIEARPGLKWSDIHIIDDPIKKNILLYLIDNPNVFFVLFNTQKGKLRIAVVEMNQWSLRRDIKVVSFLIVDNDKALADQSADGVMRILGCENIKLFVLSSNSKTTMEEIKTYIDAYAFDDEYVMPVIVLLPNQKQNEKLISLLAHIRRKVLMSNSKLRYGIIVDEADKTYPMIREKTFPAIGSERSSLLDFIINEEALHRVGFVTATDGDLLEDYQECRNAYMYPIPIDETATEHYRAFHSRDSIIKIETPIWQIKSNNAYAEHILNSNIDMFKTPINQNGESVYRKIIINSNQKGIDMTSLAQFAVMRGIYAITFNQSGICVYRPGASVEKFKIKGMRLNELLFCIYKTMGLDDKPIVIIGRRKVDRGLGYHYAPRKNQSTQRFDRQIIVWKGNVNFPGGEVISDDGDGLIWTDMILGRIEDTSTASQKAGRLAGIIGQCPLYIGLTFWTDAQTSRRIRMHNEKVDITNTLSGYSALQSINHANDMVHDIPVEVPLPDHVIHSQLFSNDSLAKDWCTANLNTDYGSSKFGLYKEDGSPGTVRNGTHIKKRGELIPICSREITERGEVGWGVQTSARIMPVRENETIQYIVIYKRGKLIT